MDGFEVCRRLKAMEETKNIQVCFITCMQSLENKLKGIELGADDFFDIFHIHIFMHYFYHGLEL